MVVHTNICIPVRIIVVQSTWSKIQRQRFYMDCCNCIYKWHSVDYCTYTNTERNCKTALEVNSSIYYPKPVNKKVPYIWKPLLSLVVHFDSNRILPKLNYGEPRKYSWKSCLRCGRQTGVEVINAPLTKLFIRYISDIAKTALHHYRHTLIKRLLYLWLWSTIN